MKSSLSNLKQKSNGGYGWVVVFASFICCCIADGLSYSVGVFQYYWTEDEEFSSNTFASFANAIFLSSPLLFSPLASIFTERYGCRIATIFGAIVSSFGFMLSFFAPNINVLCITYGFISGFGIAFIYVPSSVIIFHYFDKRLSTASGISHAGAGFGCLFGTMLLEYLIEKYAWRGCMLIISGIVLNLVVVGCFFKSEDVLKHNEFVNKPVDILGKNSFKKRITKFKNLFHKNFLLFCVSASIVYMWYDMPFIFSYKLIASWVNGKKYAKYLMMFYGFSKIFGQVVLGWLADKKLCLEIHLYMISFFIAGISTILMPLYSNFYYLAFLFLLFGWFTSADTTLTPSILLYTCGDDMITYAYGISNMFLGTSNLIGPPFCGLILDQLRNITLPYLISGTFITFSMIFLFFIKKRK